jgi:hypothetical protein
VKVCDDRDAKQTGSQNLGRSPEVVIDVQYFSAELPQRAHRPKQAHRVAEQAALWFRQPWPDAMRDAKVIQHGDARPRAGQEHDRLELRLIDGPQVIEENSTGAAPVRIGPGKKNDPVAHG